MATEDEDILEEARELFKECEEAEDDNRTEAEDDLRFARLGEQWRESDRKAREDEGRPCLTINKLPAFIRQVVNDARQNSPSITVRPVDSKADIETAEIMSGLIRDIEQQSSADIAYDTGIDYAATMGFGYWRFNLEYVDDNAFEQDIRFKRISNPFSVYGDPNSEAPDSSDWDVSFVLDRMKRDKFEKKFKGADLVSWDSPKWNDVGTPWKDGDYITYAEYWTREQIKKQIVLLSNGEIVALDDYKKQKAVFDSQDVTVVGSPRDVASHKVTQRMITGCDVLETTPWAGKYIPIVPVYGEDINVMGKRYLRSLIRDAKDPQRIHNYFRTVSAEVVALAPKAPFIGEAGFVPKNDTKWANANTKSYPYLEYVAGKKAPERQPFAGTPVGVINEALAAADDMKAVMGIYDASLGKQSNETSGKAILARQREGDVGSFHFIDNLSRAVKHGGRILIDLIPKVYSTPRIIRVLGQDLKTRNVQINQKFAGPNGVEKIFDLSVGRYDLAVDAGPSFTTRREEAANQMMELVRAYPAIAPMIGDLLAKNLDWPGAAEIAKRLHAMLPPQLQGMSSEDGQDQRQQGQPGPQPQGGAPGAMSIPPEVVEQAKQLIGKLQSELADKTAELQQVKTDKLEALAKTLIDAYQAETDRMKIAPGMAVPSPLAALAGQMPQPPAVTAPSQQPVPGLA
jgi:hypothetical protein